MFSFASEIKYSIPDANTTSKSLSTICADSPYISKCALLSSYMRRMKVLSKQKLRERDAATDS